jgi:hypothetical protein
LGEHAHCQVVNCQKPVGKEELDSLPGVQRVLIAVVGHDTHYGTNESSPDAALDKKREGVHVLAEAHDLEGLLHFGLPVADHLVEDEDARLLERHWGYREENHVAHAKPGWVIQRVGSLLT